MQYLCISIHALLAESDSCTAETDITLIGFLSTLSLRRATGSQPLSERPTRDFYPRSPCGERQCSLGNPCKKPYFYPRSPCGERRCEMISIERCSFISIHALLAESDCQWRRSVKLFRQFLSTLSLRRATLAARDESIMFVFLSTLSLRRATINPTNQTNLPGYFYPRSPCGERP